MLEHGLMFWATCGRGLFNIAEREVEAEVGLVSCYRIDCLTYMVCRRP